TVSALQEAWGSCSPVLMITTNIDAAKIGKGLGVLHELEEQTRLFRTITKATFSVRAGEDFRAVTKKAIDLALSGRPGPVCMQVPNDMRAGEVQESSTTTQEEGRGKVSLLPKRIDEAVALLRRAKQPVIVVGTDATRANLATDLTAVAEALCAPVIFSTPGKGVIAEDHSLSFGNAARRLVVKEIVPECDVALAIGTRLREVDAKRRGLVLPQLIQVDWDERWIGRNFPTAVPLVGDLRAITQELRHQLEGEPYTGQRQARVAEWRRRADAESAQLRQELTEVR